MQTLKLGTRGSRMALYQTEMVQSLLHGAVPHITPEIVVITTSGDWRPEQGEMRLQEAAGGKGLFAREIEYALLDHAVDIGVHCAKDMPSFLPSGLTLSHFLTRDDPRDCMISPKYASIDALPQGAVIGTCSTRRQAILLAKRPDLRIVPLRGNVPTRVDKLYQGQMDAIILSTSGLYRLGMESEIACILEPEDMLPAAGQGCVTLEVRQDALPTLTPILDKISDATTALCVLAERAALQVLDGSCRTPIGAYAVLSGPKMHLRILVSREDGTASWHFDETATVETPDQAIAFGQQAGHVLRRDVDPAVLAVA
ncbi:MAG: hydroxymethylbilane synthase [Pseudomonadota bacterium]